MNKEEKKQYGAAIAAIIGVAAVASVLALTKVCAAQARYFSAE